LVDDGSCVAREYIVGEEIVRTGSRQAETRNVVWQFYILYAFDDRRMTVSGHEPVSGVKLVCANPAAIDPEELARTRNQLSCLRC
jgi:hypothetical protein